MIQTTLGLLNVKELRRVDAHELIIIEGEPMEQMAPDFIHADTELIVSEVESWRQTGGVR